MTIKDWVSLSELLVRNGGIFQCILSGGEPLLLVRNPFFLDSESGFDWTVNPKFTGQFFSPILPAV
jgi:hypothetical protein